MKMAGYSALIEAIGGISGPLVAGIDSNHWSLRTDLGLAPHQPQTSRPLRSRTSSSHQSLSTDCAMRYSIGCGPIRRSTPSVSSCVRVVLSKSHTSAEQPTTALTT